MRSACDIPSAPRASLTQRMGDTLARSSLTVPVYVYRRDDGSTFEIEQRMTADPLLNCPTTGQKVARVLQPFTPRYKGTGFYSTDHRTPKGDAKTNE